MKKFIVALVLACGIGIIAYASLSNKNNKQTIKKTEKKEKKRECSGKWAHYYG